MCKHVSDQVLTHLQTCILVNLNMSWLTKKPIIALAPMADMTDSPFCRVCREVVQSVILNEVKDPSDIKRSFDSTKDLAQDDDFQPFVIFREMVSAEAIVRGNEKTLKMCEFEEIEKPIVLQLFGSNAKAIVGAAEVLMAKRSFDSTKGLTQDDALPAGIDINMGCPVPKIAGRADSGAALMKDHKRAVEIVEALKNANLGVSVSVKTRLGWSRDDEILEFAQKLEDAGVDAISIHGRTKVQGYTGKANWERIAEVKKLVSIPIIANGDITSQEDIQRCLEITGADGVMIGRGALGNPWIFQNIPPPRRGRQEGVTEKTNNPTQPSPTRVGNIEEVKRVVLRHAELHLARYGEGSMTTFRKHLLYYFKRMPNVKELRMKLARVSSLEELEKMLSICG